MKAISVWQPWASAIILGIKRIETRGRHTFLEENIAIHASKTTAGIELARSLPQREWEIIMGALESVGCYDMNDLPRGEMLGVVDLVTCHETALLPGNELYIPRHEQERELAFGDYTPGRWGLILRDPFPFEKPIPTRGQQGFFDWDIPQEVMTDELRQRLAYNPKGPVWARKSYADFQKAQSAAGRMQRGLR